MSDAAFLFDLGSPYAYLAASRVDRVLGEAVEWRPVLLGGLFKAHGRASWARGPRRALGIAEVELRARHYGLPALAWPDGWPGSYLQTMRAAVVAHEHGRVRDFALAGFRAHFASGRHLADLDAVLDVAASVGLDRDLVAARIGDVDVKQRLVAATEDAARLGVLGVPAVVVDDRVLWGDDQLEAAAEAIALCAARRRGARGRG